MWPRGLLFLKTSPVKQYSYEKDFSGVFDALHQVFLLTFVEVDMKLLLNSKLHTDRREAEANMNYLLFNNTSCSPKQKSKIVLLYKNISVEKSVIYANFRLTFLHKPCDITILRHRLCDISWNDIIIHATLGRYVTNHATSSIVDLTWLASRSVKWLLFIDYIINVNV